MRKVLVLLVFIVSLFGVGCSSDNFSNFNSNIYDETRDELSENEGENESREDGENEGNNEQSSGKKEYWTGIH